MLLIDRVSLFLTLSLSLFLFPLASDCSEVPLVQLRSMETIMKTACCAQLDILRFTILVQLSPSV